MAIIPTYSNLDWPDGRSNPAGIKSEAYFIPKSSILTFPAVKAEKTKPEDHVTYEGDFELQPSAKFFKLYTTQGMGKVTTESSGEKDCKAITNKATLVYPDLNDKAKIFATNVLNSNMIIIVAHFTSEGVKYVVFGNRDMDATIDAKGDNGAKPGDSKGLTIEISAPDYIALPNYTGLIPLDNGTLNCATGVFTPTGSTPQA